MDSLSKCKNVIEGGDLVAIVHFSSVQNGPLCQLCNTVAALLVLLVLLYTHFTRAFESKEVAFCGLEAN